MARTRSELEDDFLVLCQEFGVPIPEVNTNVHGVEVDCHWPHLGLVVELDGDANHGTSAQRSRDQRNALKLRADGLSVIRYSYDQVTYGASSVAADVLSQIEQRRRLTG
jgi:very-short-patch-repair endonuclease